MMPRRSRPQLLRRMVERIRRRRPRGLARAGWLLAGGGVIAVLVLLALAVPALLQGEGPEAAQAPGQPSPLRLLQAIGDADFPAPPESWDFRFPADHGQHEAYRTEWWYLSGILEDEEESPLGVQLLVLRLALDPEPVARSSDWAASQVYAGVHSITAPGGAGLYVDQRMSRGALGLAGAAADRLELWIESWRLEAADAPGEAWTLQIRFAAGERSLELALTPEQPPLDTSAIRARAEGPAAPFQLYLQPRIAAQGTLRDGETAVEVRGTLSMEHAWGELPLPGGAVARDRFSLYLDDGRALFCVRTHRVDGSGTPSASCLLSAADSAAQVRSGDQVELVPLAHWESGETGIRYPVRWRLRISPEGIDLTIDPHFRDQEGVGWLSFWGGPVALDPSGASSGPAGRGFVQLNGYGGAQ